MTEISWSNTTYYNDEDMRYLLARVVDALNGLNPPPKTVGVWTPVNAFSSVVIGYYGGKDRAGSATIGRHGSAKAGRLSIGIRRRTQLFGSNLETIASLAGEDPKIPPEAVGRLVGVLVRTLSSHGVGNALRQEYRDRPVKATNTWRWPEEIAKLFVDEVILPSCEIRISERAQAGSSHERKLQNAKDRVATETARHHWRREERVRLQNELEKTLEEEERAAVRLASAKTRLETLQNKKRS